MDEAAGEITALEKSPHSRYFRNSSSTYFGSGPRKPRAHDAKILRGALSRDRSAPSPGDDAGRTEPQVATRTCSRSPRASVALLQLRSLSVADPWPRPLRSCPRTASQRVTCSHTYAWAASRLRDGMKGRDGHAHGERRALTVAFAVRADRPAVLGVDGLRRAGSLESHGASRSRGTCSRRCDVNARTFGGSGFACG